MVTFIAKDIWDEVNKTAPNSYFDCEGNNLFFEMHPYFEESGHTLVFRFYSSFVKVIDGYQFESSDEKKFYFKNQTLESLTLKIGEFCQEYVKDFVVIRKSRLEILENDLDISRERAYNLEEKISNIRESLGRI